VSNQVPHPASAGREVYVRDQLVLQPANGWVRFIRQAQVLLDRATAGVVYTGSSGEKKALALAGHAMSYGLARDSVSLSVADGQLELNWQVVLGNEMRLRLEVKNIGSHVLRIEELHILDVDAERGGTVGLRAAPKNWRFYQNGWQSWAPTFARHVADGIWVNPNTDDYRVKHLPHALDEEGKTFSSEWFTVLSADAQGDAARPNPALLLGFLTTADQFGEVRLQVSDSAGAGRSSGSLQFQTLRAISYADGIPLAPGDKLSSETLLLTAGDNPLSLLDLYATRLGETMHARAAPLARDAVAAPLARDAVAAEALPLPTGWCTWYYFYGEDSANDVLTNMEWIAKKQLPLDLILIDDGYEMNIGDWQDVSAEKYPQGMKDIAAQIQAAGYRPGIWTAPFAISSQSKLYAEHPDWALRNEVGEPLVAWQHWGKDIYGLDLTLPAVQDWLRDLFHTLSDDWGFQFFKIDFIYAAALPGARYDPRMTRAQAVRRGLEIIRAAIGDKFLLGCGCPLGPAVGLVDGMRIGPDVHVDWKPFWQDLSAPSTSNAMLNSIARGFMHNKLWLNDADCLVLRPRGPDSNLVLNEMRTLTTVVGLSGGLVLDSDHLPAVRRGRLEYLRRVLPPYGRSAIPVDLFEHERPRLLALPIQTAWGSWTIVALINWDDHTCATTLDLAQLDLPAGSYHVYNYWRRRYLGVVSDQVTIDPHQPHETVLLLLKRASDKPQLLTSTFHILQGAAEVKAVQVLPDRLVVELEKRGKQFGRLLFAVPADPPVAKVLVNGRPQRPRRVADGIWQAGFVLTDRATVELLLG
jgi:alpha-galactosidase